MNVRVGIGYDVHAFATDRRLILGGVSVPFHYGLAGHSDADVVIHAIVDALLGSASLGDIGQHFPASDMRWKGLESRVFLEYVCDLLPQHGWSIANIDTTIVAEKPLLSPYIPEMRSYLAEHIHLTIDQISVKATTTEGLGFAGRQEGIGCYAVALIQK